MVKHFANSYTFYQKDGQNEEYGYKFIIKLTNFVFLQAVFLLFKTKFPLHLKKKQICK